MTYNTLVHDFFPTTTYHLTHAALRNHKDEIMPQYLCVVIDIHNALISPFGMYVVPVPVKVGQCMSKHGYIRNHQTKWKSMVVNLLMYGCGALAWYQHQSDDLGVRQNEWENGFVMLEMLETN